MGLHETISFFTAKETIIKPKKQCRELHTIFTHIYCSIIHNGQTMERVQVSYNRRTNSENVRYIYIYIPHIYMTCIHIYDLYIYFTCMYTCIHICVYI
jgi:hypothetical protein